jgi:hypothetical protein
MRPFANASLVIPPLLHTALQVTAASGRRTEVSDLDKYDDGVSRHVLGFCT